MKVDAPFRTSHFRVVLTAEELARLGCSHTPMRPETCRPCSVSMALLDAMRDETIIFDWDSDWYTMQRIIHGTLLAVGGRAAFTRLMALAHGHPEPATLLAP